MDARRKESLCRIINVFNSITSQSKFLNLVLESLLLTDSNDLDDFIKRLADRVIDDDKKNQKHKQCHERDKNIIDLLISKINLAYGVKNSDVEYLRFKTSKRRM